ncbi:MAG: ORF6N domain-containing protein [Fimbriimonadales bacterium]
MAKKLPSPAGRLPVPQVLIERRIYLIRGQKVMLDSGLAELYQVLTKNLNLAVRRNLGRFPEDFMFQLTPEEAASLRLQSATSNVGRGGRRYLPYAFSELGVAMLSSVLNSERAVQMNIIIMRAFVRLREILAGNLDLAHRLDQVEATLRQHGGAIGLLADEIGKLKQPPPRPPKPRIGFHLPEER